MKKGLLLLIIIFYSCGVDTDVIDYNNNDVTIRLLFPENNSESTDGIIISDSENELIFNWEDDYKTESSNYALLLTNLFSNETTTFESTETEIAIILERDISYSWSVTENTNKSSETYRFNNIGPWRETTPPLPAIAISPVSGASISQTSITVNLIWQSEDIDNDIIGHDLFFGETEDPQLFLADITGNRYNDIPVTAGKTYYWKIVTKDSAGNETSSPVFTFNVG